jgi:hypothetical protein
MLLIHGVQLSKTWRLEKVIGILEAVGIHILAIMIGLYHNSGKLHKVITNCSDLKLTGAITTGRAILLSFTGLLALLMFHISVTAS